MPLRIAEAGEGIPLRVTILPARIIAVAASQWWPPRAPAGGQLHLQV